MAWFFTVSSTIYDYPQSGGSFKSWLKLQRRAHRAWLSRRDPFGGRRQRPLDLLDTRPCGVPELSARVAPAPRCSITGIALTGYSPAPRHPGSGYVIYSMAVPQVGGTGWRIRIIPTAGCRASIYVWCSPRCCQPSPNTACNTTPQERCRTWLSKEKILARNCYSHLTLEAIYRLGISF